MNELMNPESRRILLNFLSRRSGFIAGAVLLHFGGSLYFLQGTITSPLFDGWHDTFKFGSGIILMLVMMDVMAKPMRALLALPIRQEDLWKIYWRMTFALPAVASTVVSLLALAVVRSNGPLGVPVQTVLVWFIGQWGSLALGWCCLCLLPSDEAVARRRRITSFIASGLWGVQSTFFLVFIPTTPVWSYVVLVGSAVALWGAIFGRELTGQFILERIGRPDDFPSRAFNSGRGREGSAGLRGWKTLLAIYGPVSTFLLAIPLVIRIPHSMVGWNGGSDPGGILSMIIGIQVCIGMSFVFSRNLISGLRVVRSLPVSSREIVTVLMASGWVPTVGFGLGCLVLPGRARNGLEEVLGFAVLLTMVSSFPLLILRFRSLWVAVPAFVAIPFLIGLRILPPGATPGGVWSVLTASFAIILVLAVRTWWEIHHGRRAYATRLTPVEGLIAN